MAEKSRLIDKPLPVKPTKSEEKRLRDITERAGQGNRIDWTIHLHVDLPTGYRVTRNERLSHIAKLIRSSSLKAAADRRSKRRTEEGTVVSWGDAFRSATRHGPPALTFPQERWLDGQRPEGWFTK